MRHRVHALCVVAAMVVARSATAGPPPPATSLNNCQNAVRAATKQFVNHKVAAIGGCLQAVSTQIVKKNAADASGAAAMCVTQFRKLNDSRGLGKQLSDKLAAAITKKCDPTQPGVTHTLADIIGSGAGVPQPLEAEDLNAWCAHFGGDGAVGSVQEWIDCLTAAAECSVDAALATQYPRALEWLALVQPAMQALTPPAADLNKITDAVAALVAVEAEIDGPNNDNAVSIQCGNDGVCDAGLSVCTSSLATCNSNLSSCNGSLSTCNGDLSTCNTSLVGAQACGNAAIDGGESCDQSNLNGATCVTQGFPGGTLKCGANCAFDTSDCFAPARFADNANGTITDKQTGLMWEKKVKLDGTTDFTNLQDADDYYAWAGTCSVNTSKYCQPTAAAAAVCAVGVEGDPTGCAQCTGGDGTCSASTTVWTWLADLNLANFATHNDWRLPKRAELEGILDLLDTIAPTVDVAFQGASCGASCTDITDAACACTQSSDYWSSTTFGIAPVGAWTEVFGSGHVFGAGKTNGKYVRAVRGGS